MDRFCTEPRVLGKRDVIRRLRFRLVIDDRLVMHDRLVIEDSSGTTRLVMDDGRAGDFGTGWLTLAKNR